MPGYKISQEKQRNTISLVTLESEFGQKLVKKFGEQIAQEFLDLLHEEGLPIEFPANLIDGITLNGVPEIRVELLDGNGQPLKGGCTDYARSHRWVAYINGQPQLTAKSIKIPKLDYTKTDILTVKMSYYCINEKEIASQLSEQKAAAAPKPDSKTSCR